jgi:hypothetical protein
MFIKSIDGHSGTARSAGPGIQNNTLRLALDSGLAPSARPGMTIERLDG